MRILRFLRRILREVAQGRFALAVYSFTMELPNWLFTFNQAWLMRTESFRFPDRQNSQVQVRLATSADVADIKRVSDLSEERIDGLMKAGAKCFVASLPGTQPMALTWSAQGRIYVRGLGFEYNFGPAGYYSFWVKTLPEARKKGMFVRLQCERVKHEIECGGLEFYAFVEFTNEYSRGLHEKLGYRALFWVTYVRLLGVRWCYAKNLSGGKSSLQIRLREPTGDIVTI